MSAARPAWQADAACAGMDSDLFFPGQGDDTRPAKAVCATCPVTAQCAQAGQDELFGIWGGLSTRERVSGRRSGNYGPVPKPIVHGTVAGSLAHRRRGERPCVPCLLAWRTYNAQKQREYKARQVAS